MGDWVAPSWHSDFGDVRAEFEDLRGLAMRLTALGYVCRLDRSEPGYMEVQVLGADGRRVGGYCMAAGSAATDAARSAATYAIVVGAGERYATDIEQAVEAFV